MFKSASWETACPFQPGANIRGPGAAPGSTFPSLSVPGSDPDSTSPGACSGPLLRPRKQAFPSPDARWGRQGRTSPGQVRAGAPAGAAVGSQQLLAGPPRGCAGGRAGGPEERAAEGEPSGLTLPTPPPASSPRPPRGATGAEAGGCPRPERAPARSGPRTGRGSCRPRTCPVHTSDAPSRPQPLQGSPECVHAAGSGRHGGDATVGARPRRLGELQRAPGAGWPRAGETHRATGYLRSGTGVSQNPSQSSASTTQDGRHVATHVT